MDSRVSVQKRRSMRQRGSSRLEKAGPANSVHCRPTQPHELAYRSQTTSILSPVFGMRGADVGPQQTWANSMSESACYRRLRFVPLLGVNTSRFLIIQAFGMPGRVSLACFRPAPLSHFRKGRTFRFRWSGRPLKRSDARHEPNRGPQNICGSLRACASSFGAIRGIAMWNIGLSAAIVRKPRRAQRWLSSSAK